MHTRALISFWALALSAGAVFSPAGAEGVLQPSPERRAALIHLVREDCGSCHGLTLTVGLGPALLPETLAGKEAASLESTVRHGRPGTPMPPWQAFLTEAEARWIVEQLQKGFPDEIR